MRYEHSVDGETFEWDPKKAESNLAKHGVTFEAACEVFFDPLVVITDADTPADARDAAIGYAAESRLLFVVFLESDEEAIRIISARLATRSERSSYESK